MKRKKCYSIVCIIFLFLSLNSFFVSADSKCTPEINLPSDPVTMAIELSPDGWLKSLFKITLEGINGDFDVGDGEHYGWCIEFGTDFSKVPLLATVYSSYDPKLSSYLESEYWPEVNYILNNKHPDASLIEIQRAIWYFLNFGSWEWDTAWESFGPVDPASPVFSMIENASLHGENYCPDPDGVIALILDIRAYESDTQLMIIELPLPQKDTPPSPTPTKPTERRNTPPTADGSKNAPYIAMVNEDIIFDGSQSYDYDGWIVEWLWSFGDGTNSEGELVTYAYENAGIYPVYLNVTDNDGSQASYLTIAEIIQANRPPSIPTMQGETEGDILISYVYRFVSTDLDGDSLRYLVDFGDGSDIHSTEFQKNNTEVMIAHIWNTEGVYLLEVYAEDEMGARSPTAQMTITVTEPAGGGDIIGFELFILVAAIGIALVLFKRLR